MSSVTPVKGYTAQPQWKLDAVNYNKETEERILRDLETLGSNGPAAGFDKRWLAIAKTKFEEAFMAYNRAIMSPQRIKLPGDGD
jgi:hypothetical protein